jgi:hypothetical protein
MYKKIVAEIYYEGYQESSQKEVLLNGALHFHKGIVAEIDESHKRFRKGTESIVHVTTR